MQQKNQEVERKDREIALREAKLKKVQFELARLKRWKFGAKTEVMNADQRRLFEETLAEDEAGLQAQLDALRAEASRPRHDPEAAAPAAAPGAAQAPASRRAPS